MTDLLTLIARLWPLAVVLCSIVSTGAVLYLRSHYAPLSVFDALDEKMKAIDTRLAIVERHIEESPTRAELQEDVKEITARLSALEASFSGMSRLLEVTNTYLHTIIEKGMK